MNKGGKLRLAGGAGVLLALGAIFWARHGSQADRAGAGAPTGEGPDHARRWRGYAAGTPGIAGGADPAAPGQPGAPPDVSPAEAAETAERVKGVMGAWSAAIVAKDADTVLMLDATFTATPDRYLEALSRSASSDANERVRAFSTRVLGKLKAPRLVELFAKLLEDTSPYVRQNAAWALGELGSEPEGRQAAQRVATELQRLARQDAARDVRAAASGALMRLR